MSSPVAKIGLLVAALALSVAVVAAPAQAGEVVFTPQDNSHPTSSDGWQAGTCKADAPIKCSVDNPELFFETAAGHPPVGFTQFIIKHTSVLGHEEPERNLKTIRVDLPIGLSVNPGATPQCASPSPKECAVAAPLS
ncbi:MAG TPA: hypothetical protein VNN15_09020, partial [Solirubrobacterales bacterium]|nr:hypothetical protein [Solirubrobacterales bacterium]